MRMAAFAACRMPGGRTRWATGAEEEEEEEEEDAAD